MAQHDITIIGRDYDAMADVVRKHKVSVLGHTVRKLAKRGFSVRALATTAQVRALQKTGYKVKQHEDLDKAGRKRQAELRNAQKKKGLHVEGAAVAAAGTYLSVADVEAALAAAAASPNDTFVTLIKLPNKTWENRECHAVKIAKGSSHGRPGIYFLGGVHAREWGSPDILINFVQQLTNAYRTNTDITIGSKTFTAAAIQKIVNKKDIYVFPQANPDGRNYSMITEAMWRKNRRPAPAHSNNSACVGVDINRNYDFLWNFPAYFDPAAPIANSTNPCDHDVYIGPNAVSEPETRNAVWMWDTYPNIGYFIDVHSFGEDILYIWGDDLDQTRKPNMNFQNSAFDGKRGIANDAVYKEFIKASDKTAHVKLARHMRDAIKAVRGHLYTVEQSTALYPTAGTSDDYAFSRHLVDPAKPKVYSYTIEWGSGNNPTPFHPPYSEMQKIIEEITAALLEFCVRAG